MKRLLFIFIVSFFPALAGAVQLPDNMFFRAMNDEMQRSLKELRLKDHPNPYYIAYWLFHSRNLTLGANMGTLRPQVDNPQPKGDLRVVAFVSVGSDKQDGLGFASEEYPYWREIELPAAWGALGYESIRQYLWKLTDRAYLNAVNLYITSLIYYLFLLLWFTCLFIYFWFFFIINYFHFFSISCFHLFRFLSLLFSSYFFYFFCWFFTRFFLF